MIRLENVLERGKFYAFYFVRMWESDLESRKLNRGPINERNSVTLEWLI